MGRTHRVDLAFLHECLLAGQFSIEYCETTKMAADVFTKAFSNAQKWQHACSLIGLSKPGEHWPKEGEKRVAAVEAAPARKKGTVWLPRRVVEFCTGESSLIGEHGPCTKGCEMIRLTIEDDVTSQAGRAKAIEAVSLKGTLLWASMPCAGGSPWQRINRKRPGMKEKLEEHWKTFRAIWASFVIVAHRCLHEHGIVAIEWPNGCKYWKWPEVTEFLAKNSFTSVRADGCALGLASRRTGLPILKPWRIACSSPLFLIGFEG
jgi:hypothetical protein